MGTIASLTDAFWRCYRASGTVDPGAVRRLAARALGATPEADEAARALFAEIVEPLADAFESAAAHAFVDLFAEVLEVARRDPRAEELDRGLAELGVTSERVAARGHCLLDAAEPAPPGKARLVFVLSRITLGAEVAMATPIVAALLARDPATRVVFVGPGHARGLFAGNSRVTFRCVDYPRRGDLLARLGCWVPVREIVRRESMGLADDEWLVVDPDSRLTQTGLMPVAPDNRIRFFPSRTIEWPGEERLGQLAGRWAQRLTGAAEPPLPRVWLTEAAQSWAAALLARLRAEGRPWAVVNLGVGGNPRKSMGPEFEARLLRWLLEDSVGVLLARGTSEAEVERALALTGRLAATGVDVLHLPPDAGSGALDEPGQRQLVTWQGTTEQMAALVAAADLHVGYDSAGQHVAAAVGTPGVTVFVAAAGERHFRRWSPWGSGATRIVRAEPDAADVDAVVASALAAVRELLR